METNAFCNDLKDFIRNQKIIDKPEEAKKIFDEICGDNEDIRNIMDTILSIEKCKKEIEKSKQSN